MRTRVALLAAVTLVVTPLVGQESDQEYPHAFPRPGVEKLMENERVIVWEATWPADVEQVYHRHRYDMTGVFLRWGPLRVTRPNGTYTESLEPWAEVPRVFFQQKGVTHKEEGIGEPVRHAIMIDLKEYSPIPPEVRPDVRSAFPLPGSERVIDNERVTVWSISLQEGDRLPLHHHERDVVWAFVEGGTIRWTAEDGRTSRFVAEAPGVRFMRAGTAHSIQVASGSPVAMVYELK